MKYWVCENKSSFPLTKEETVHPNKELTMLWLTVESRSPIHSMFRWYSISEQDSFQDVHFGDDFQTIMTFKDIKSNDNLPAPLV